MTLANTNAGSYNAGIQFELTENSPLFTLGVDDSDGDKFKIFAGSDISGTSQFSIDSTGTTSIANLQLGTQSFEADAGAVTWIDMPVTATPTAGTVERYTAMIDANPLLTVYAEADGAGSIQNSGVSIGNSTLQAGAKFAVTQSSTSTTAGTMYASYNSISDTGIVTTGTDTTYGNYTTVTRTGATGGTINSYGSYTVLTTDNAGSGTSTAYGSYIDTGTAGATNADTVYGQYINTESNAGTAYGLYVDAGTGAGTEYAAAFMNGAVGIGTATPTVNVDLQVGSTSVDGANNTIRIADIGGRTAMLELISGGSLWSLGTQESGSSVNQSLIFSTAGLATKMTLTNTGNLGIGDSTPDSQLDVLSSGAAHTYMTLANTNAGNYNAGIQFELTENSPLFTLGVDDSDGDKFKIFAGSDISGTSQFSIDSTGTTSIANLQLGTQSFETNAGIISWVDMPVTSSATAGTVESYSAQIDANPLLTVYAESDGAGSIQNSGVSVGNSTLQTGAKFAVTQASTSTTAGTMYGVYNAVSDTGIVTTSTDTTYGNYTSLTRTGATGGTINTYGDYINVTADNAGSGTSTATGLYVAVAGADTNYSGIFTGGNFGIGDTTPAALFTVGSGDLFQVNSSGAITAVANISGMPTGGIADFTGGQVSGNYRLKVAQSCNGCGTDYYGESIVLTGDTSGLLKGLDISVSNSSGNMNALNIAVTNAAVAANIEYGSLTTVNDTGVTTTGTDTTYGNYNTVTRTGATGGTINTYGENILLTTDNAGSGTSTAYGMNIDTGTAGATNADTVYGLKIASEANASTTTYGLYVDVGAQAGTEYSAVFLNGNVGIGTATPAAMLDIYGTSNALRLSYDGSNYNTLSTDSAGTLSLASSNTAEAAIVVGTGSASQDVSVQFDSQTNDFFTGVDITTGNFMIGTGSTVQAASAYETITSTGLIGINMTPTARFDVTHSSTSTTGATEYSVRNTFADTGVVTTGTDTTYGDYLSMTRTGATGGTINTYGSYTVLTTDNAGSGTSTAYGSYIDTGTAGATNADTTYGMYINTEANTGTTATGLYVDAGTQAGTEYAAAFMNGGVGIGTATPTTAFEISSSAASDVIATITSATTTNDPLLKLRTGASPSVQFTLGVDTSDSSKFKIFSGDGLGGGDEFVIDSNGVTTIANLNLGATVFDTDAGAVSWIDMAVSASATAGTVESYTAMLDGTDMLTVYAEADGSGGLQNKAINLLNNSVQAKLLSTNFGTATYGGAFVSNNAYYGQEFGADTTGAITADSATLVGDDGKWYFDTTDVAATYTQADQLNGYGSVAVTTTATDIAGGVFFGEAQNNLSLIFAKANLPVVQMKLRNTDGGTTGNDVVWGLMDQATSVATNDTLPANGIFFWNNNTTTWTGVVRSGGANVGTVTCGTISTTQFAVGRIEVISATSVKFYMDTDVSDGVSMSLCGTVTGANPTAALGLGAYVVHTETTATSVDIDYARVWQDDASTGTAVATTPKKRVAPVVPDYGELGTFKLVTDSNASKQSIDSVLQVTGDALNTLSEENLATEVKLAEHDTQFASDLANITALQVTTDKLSLDVNAQMTKTIALESQMQTLENQMSTLMEFFTTFDLGNIVAKDLNGNVDLLGGRIKAKALEAGGIAIEVTDPEAPTIGTATILPIEHDTDNDGKDDETGSDGKSVAVMTKAMIPMIHGSRIFTNFKSNPNAFSWVEKIIDDKGDYVGFRIRLSSLVTEKVKADWWLIEQKDNITPTP
jgi:hypothetical protein